MYYIDNFFKNPYFIRKIALNQKYSTPDTDYGWKGFRCKTPECLSDVDLSIKKCVCRFFNKNNENYTIESYFHYSTIETKDTCFPSFEEYKYHVDDADYAGIVYLSPDPPVNTGTTFLNIRNDKILIDNIYNRLVCYQANIFHGPTDLFGLDIKTGRLTLTFFLKGK